LNTFDANRFNTDWAEVSVSIAGELLPVTFIGYNPDTDLFEVGYEVPDALPPIEVGEDKVRIITVNYTFTGNYNG
jgi:hypothetical protein